MSVRSRVLILTAMLITVVAGPAVAQTALDASVVTASTMGPEQRAAVDRLVDRYGNDLTNDDPDKRSTARAALLDPTDQAGVSVVFRMYYSDRLIPLLEQVVNHEDTRIAINGLRIAGALATDDSTRLLMDTAAHEKVDMRYVAAMGILETFSQVNDKSSPAINQVRLEDLVELLEARLGFEPNPYVFDVVGQALTGAGRLQRPQWSDIADYARQAQARVTAQRIVKLNPGPDDRRILIAVARTLEAQRFTITDMDASNEVAQQAAALAGQCVSYAASRARAGTIAENDRLILWDLVGRAESLIAFAHDVLDPGANPPSTDVARHLANDGDPSKFDDDAMTEAADAQLIGPDGALCGPPFNFSPRDFERND